MNNLVNRMIRAAKLDVHLYEEVEADTKATGQAMAVVTLSSIAASFMNIGSVGFGGIFIGIVVTLVGWFIWALLTFIVGTKLLPESQTQSNPGELLRTIGFSSSPGLIRVLGIIPGLGKPLIFIASVWMLVAMVIAVRQALDYKSTMRAVGVCIIGWIIQMIIMFFMLSVFVRTAAETM